MDITVNYLAVLVAGVVAYAVGAWWHSPLGFGKQWMGMVGLTEGHMKTMPLTAVQAMSIGFVVTLLVSFVLAHFIVLVGANNVNTTLQLGFWLWLGFLAPTLANGWLWEGKSAKLFAFNALYALVSIEIMALVLSLWQ